MRRELGGTRAPEELASRLQGIFANAGCVGRVCVQSLDDKGERELRADEPAVAASTIKVLIALEAARQLSEGALDPASRIVLHADRRSSGGTTGFSLFELDVDVALGDLLVQMLTVSDNEATDALLDVVGVDACNELARSIGLTSTVLAGTMRELVATIATDLGFASWAELERWITGRTAEEVSEHLDASVLSCGALDPAHSTRTTARDMGRVLRLIWTDAVAAPEWSQRIRGAMSRQLQQTRIASGFPRSTSVAAKSGSLLGVVRNEVGVVELGPCDRYAVAIFTESAAGDGRAIDAAIGEVARVAVSDLHGDAWRKPQ